MLQSGTRQLLVVNTDTATSVEQVVVNMNMDMNMEQVVSTPGAANMDDLSVAMLDLKDKMVNATAFGLSKYGNATFAQRAWLACVSWLIYVVFALMIWALCYPPPPVRVADPKDVEDPSQTFREGHFQCLRNPSICLCACLCPGLRWADTMSMAGFLKISSGLSLVFFCALLNGFAYTTALVGPFTFFLCLYYRQELREQYALNSWSCSSCFADCLYLLLCPWCALAQEARVVTHSLQQGQPK